MAINKIFTIAVKSLKKATVFVGIFVVIFVPVGIALDWPHDTPFSIDLLWKFIVGTLLSPLLYMPIIIMWIVFLITGVVKAKENS